MCIRYLAYNLFYLAESAKFWYLEELQLGLVSEQLKFEKLQLMKFKQGILEISWPNLATPNLHAPHLMSFCGQWRLVTARQGVHDWLFLADFRRLLQFSRENAKMIKKVSRGAHPDERSRAATACPS